MSLMIESCKKCDHVLGCYIDDFERCPKIEAAADGLGVPVGPRKRKEYLENIPFGVFMGLKHIVNRLRLEKWERNRIISVGGLDTNCDNYAGNQYCNLHQSKVASAYCGDICSENRRDK